VFTARVVCCGMVLLCACECHARQTGGASRTTVSLLRTTDGVCPHQGFKMVLLLRLSPVIPFNAFNYFMGLTGVRFWQFAAGSVGMIPGTVAFVYIGSLLSDVKNAISGDATDENPTVKWAVLILGIIATVVAVVLITIYAKRELGKHLQMDPKPTAGEAKQSASSKGGEAEGAVGSYTAPSTQEPSTQEPEV